MATNTQETTATRVLIIGAGVTGLAIAHGLQKAGIPYTVFDHEAAASTYRPREWTMGIHWALPLLESLLPAHLAATLNETYVDPSLDWDQPPCDRMRMYNGLTGEIMKDIPIKGKIVRVSRRKLRVFLAREIDVKYNHNLVDIRYGDNGTVTAIFANGAEEMGSLVVGADGPRSAVRNLLFGQETAAAVPLDQVIHTNITYCPGDAEKARILRSSHPVWSIVMHPELFCMLSLQDTSNSTDPTTWKFQVACGWLGDRNLFPTPQSRTQELKRRALLLPEPFRSAILWIPLESEISFDAINYWETEIWDGKQGRVVLAGDAAHPMPPHRGQGLNHAIQDAHNLITYLTTSSSNSLASNLQSYAEEVAERGKKEVSLSKQNAFMVLDWRVLEQSPVFKHALDRSPVVEYDGDGKSVVAEDGEGEVEHDGEVENGTGKEEGAKEVKGECVNGTKDHDENTGEERHVISVAST